MIRQEIAPTSAPQAHGWDQRWTAPAICLALAAITFAVFGQTAGFEFVNFDDNVYVYQNATVAEGLSLKGLAWVFTHADCSLYHPLTMLSLMADHQFYGSHAGGYHFTNVLLHTASVILLFLILRQMTGALWRSAFVAAVFAIHPLRAESVAWVAERKDVLGGFFFMLTLGAYVRYVRKPDSLARYLMVAAAFVLAVLSKPTVVTLPFVLLLLDYWPLQRFEDLELVQTRKYFRIPRRLILEKIPLLALAAAACAITALAAGTEIGINNSTSMPSRICNAVVSYAVYLRQVVWPGGLAVLYPVSRNGGPAWEVALAVTLLAGLSVVAWRERRSRPWLLIGWLWYLGMLTPMIGIVQMGIFAHADRNTYLPQIGIYAAVTWLMAEWRVSRVILGGLMTGVLAILMVCAWKQTAYWENSETLWAHTIACTKNNEIAHNNLGNVLYQEGFVDEAIPHFQQALQINPENATTHFNLGNALLQKGRVAETISHFQKALQLKADDPEMQDSLAWLLATCPQAALRNGNQAVELAQRANQFTSGKNPIILRTLAAGYAEAGRFSEAVETAQRALHLAEAQSNASLAGQLQIELKLYQAGSPFHLPEQKH